MMRHLRPKRGKSMRMRLQRDIDKLKKRIVRLGAVVEERFHMAVKAIECKNADWPRMSSMEI